MQEIRPDNYPHPTMHIRHSPNWNVDRSSYSIQIRLQLEHDEYVRTPGPSPKPMADADRYIVAELVLVSVGFLFLIDPVIELWRRHIASCLPTHEQPGWVKRAAWILKVGLLAAIATGVVGASKTSSALNTQDGAQTVQQLRKVSYVLALGTSSLSRKHIFLTGKRTS
jgi:hypothetical protein